MTVTLLSFDTALSESWPPNGLQSQIVTRHGTTKLQVRSLIGVKQDETKDLLPSKCCSEPTVAPRSSFQLASALIKFANTKVKMMGKIVGFCTW